MAQLYLIGAGPELQLYISPVNWRPENPPAAMSSPASLSADIYERLGPYRTLGWAEATWPLNEDRIDEKVFMEDLYRAFDDRAQVILQRIDTKQWDLVVGVIESTDRVQHMMWRLLDPTHPMYDKALAAKYGDSIERVYQKCDDFIGEVMSRVGETTPILIVSDHGFHSFRQSVNLNTWLVQEGFMAIRGQQPGEKKLQDLFGGGTFWENVDWNHTKAYAMGLGQIYVNLKDREAHGIVAQGDESRRLQDELVA
jgi:predicted AlkP superfamily phosphohydrolase/phosphomutase